MLQPSACMNKLTANEYHARLDIFKRFVKEKYSISEDDIISKIKKNGNPYSLLIEYADIWRTATFQRPH